ncbi:DUF1415 domain-containing protein [Aestuariirhabdus litorea]|uniref:DUF1415 domain-containing protein n=1 Tax=Aestuariirhabdus litorea TaxID=2528527 RepID=A0A3P3VNU6_9GAMM|nr:DUF1415 domain-containing protein [Aestuariirhabdus litorea]RRJ84375.1 DUF1415 domain-containing protein [Aestuariirhabdus litorea]RWW97599.1 DUF1415 family protein [Endozoicomonadaceae bacterium GTF-13]
MNSPQSVTQATSDSHPAVPITRNWVERVVVGLNFCPFAKREFELGRINYRVMPVDVDEALLLMLNECQRLEEEPEIETTLLIFSNSLQDFDDFLVVIDIANQLLEEQGYEGVFQLASFHPDYRFAGCSEEDPANFTNRSPYPMLHLLREASLTRVLEKHTDPESIPATNMERARTLGVGQLNALLAGCSQPEA